MIYEDAIVRLARELYGGIKIGITGKNQLHGVAVPNRGFMVSVPWLSMAWKGDPPVSAISRWIDLHRGDLTSSPSPWQIEDVPTLRTPLPLYAGAWQDGGITWIDANIVFPDDRPTAGVSGDLLEHARSGRIGSKFAGRFCPERTYTTAAEVAQFAGRAWGQIDIFDIENDSSIPSDHSW
jgi:hypothetical protein